MFVFSFPRDKSRTTEANLVRKFGVRDDQDVVIFGSKGRSSGLQDWKLKGKGSSLGIAPFTILDSGALQPRKRLLTGIDCSTVAKLVAAHSPR